MSFDLIRNAHVAVTPIVTGSGKQRSVQAEVTINDKYQHRFPTSSRVSKHLDVMDASDLAERLSGGSYFFVDAEQGNGSQLVDFRDGQYSGFVHPDASIGKFMETIGIQTRDALPGHRNRRGNNEDGTQIVLRKVWSKDEIAVPGFKAGGEFHSQLSFVWNPFVKTINSSFDLIRLICTNGMIGLTSFLNTKVPLLNRWEEHLDIASRQIQNKVNSIVVDRVQSMRVEQASVGECLLLEQHAYDRLYAPGAKSEDERARLLALMSAVAPSAHLAGVYQAGVFTNKSLAAQLPAHLSHFDVWNIATELRSHTSQSKKSSDTALDRFANGVMFDNDDYSVAGANQIGASRTASFSDPERAFYGLIN
jgi:hypothetical protein